MHIYYWDLFQFDDNIDHDCHIVGADNDEEPPDAVKLNLCPQPAINAPTCGKTDLTLCSESDIGGIKLFPGGRMHLWKQIFFLFFLFVCKATDCKTNAQPLLLCNATWKSRLSGDCATVAERKSLVFFYSPGRLFGQNGVLLFSDERCIASSWYFPHLPQIDMDRTSLKDKISFLIDLISQGPMGTNHNPLELDWIWLHLVPEYSARFVRITENSFCILVNCPINQMCQDTHQRDPEAWHNCTDGASFTPPFIGETAPAPRQVDWVHWGLNLFHIKPHWRIPWQPLTPSSQLCWRSPLPDLAPALPTRCHPVAVTALS